MALNNIKIVIGSWGSYNECNERALGSKKLDLADFSDWDEIVKELKRQGFKLDGIDEELFIQSIDNFPSSCENLDYIHPKTLFNLLYEADVLEDSHKYDVLMAFLEVWSFNDFKQLVEKYGSSWDNDIYLYKDYDWEDYGREMFETMGYQMEDWMLDYFDFKRYGESIRFNSNITKYSEGLIEIRR